MLAEINRLQITSPIILNQQETKIIKDKFAMLNKSLLFGEQTLELSYLQKLHLFLFEDIYYPSELSIRSEYSKKDLLNINGMLQNIIFLAEEKNLDICYLKEVMYNLWSFQLFGDGNNRTLWAYLKVFIDYYELSMELQPFKENCCGKFHIVAKSSKRPYAKN